MFRSRLLSEGYRSDEVRRLRRGAVTVRRGAYVGREDVRLRSPETAHLLAVRAAVEHLRGDAVVSHASAALLHGIALWAVPLGRVHVTRAGTAGGRRSRTLHLHVTDLDSDEIDEVDGIVVTAAARTVVDLARSVPFEQAVVAVDNALHRHLVTHDALAGTLTRSPRRHGAAVAARAIAFADGRAESPGESRSRVCIHRAGLPRPDLQVPVTGADGRPLGRADFGWAGARVVGEFDGRAKYGRMLRPGQDPGDAVFAEKVREDAIRDGGTWMTRWTWSDLDSFTPTAARLARALGEAGVPVAR